MDAERRQLHDDTGREIDLWYRRAGQPLADGGSRRAALEPPLYQRIAGQVMDLERRGLLLQDMATALGVDRATVTKALEFWRAMNGAVREDGRSRRKRLPRPDTRRGGDSVRR